MERNEWANVTHHHDSNFNFNLIQWLLFSHALSSEKYTQQWRVACSCHFIHMTFKRCDERNVCKLMHDENCVNTTRSRRLSCSENGNVKEMEMSWRQSSTKKKSEHWELSGAAWLWVYLKQSSSMKFHFLLYFFLIVRTMIVIIAVNVICNFVQVRLFMAMRAPKSSDASTRQFPLVISPLYSSHFIFILAIFYLFLRASSYTHFIPSPSTYNSI